MRRVEKFREPCKECGNNTFLELTPKEAEEHGVRHWGMCYHVYTCMKCGKILTIDSSG
jgi:hypothetical protein